jgi:tetratricopeptide (TPR) repeat protein
VDWSYDLLTAEEREVFDQLSVFAGSFGLAQLAEVCTGADQGVALEVIDRLAAKSLVSAEPAEVGTRYRLLETLREYAAARLAEAGDTQAARRRHGRAFLGLAGREHQLAVLARDQDNFRAVLRWSLSAGDEAGPRLVLALGDFWLARGLVQEGRGWLERTLAQNLPDQCLRAGLLRLLGTVLYEAGELEQAQAVLAEGSQVAAAAGAATAQARIRILRALIRTSQGGSDAEALAECQAATAVLESEGDLEGLAEGWLVAGTLRYWSGDVPAGQEALERAIACAWQSGNHRAQAQASGGLATTFLRWPIPIDAAIARVEQLLHDVGGEPAAQAHVLIPLSQLYALAGRFAEARAAIARCRSLLMASGARFDLARSAQPAGRIELAADDPASAERCFREGYEAFRAMGERGYCSSDASLLAEALYRQGRLDEAQQMTEETQSIAPPSDLDAQARWRTVRAKLQAWRGQFPAARQLLAEAEALISPTSDTRFKAEILVAEAEVDQLAGDRDQAAASFHAALRIYEDRRVASLAVQAKAALARLAAQPGARPS